MLLVLHPSHQALLPIRVQQPPSFQQQQKQNYYLRATESQKKTSKQGAIDGSARDGHGVAGGGTRRRVLGVGGRGGAALQAAREPPSHRLPQFRRSSPRRRGRDHGDVVPERDGRHGRGVQEGEAEAVLRAGEPEGARVAQDPRRPQEGQDLPVQGQRAGLCQHRQRHVPRRPRHPHRHLLRARLRPRRLRHAGRLRPDRAQLHLQRRQHHRRHHLHQGRRRRLLRLLHRLARLLFLHRETQEEQLRLKVCQGCSSV